MNYVVNAIVNVNELVLHGLMVLLYVNYAKYC